MIPDYSDSYQQGKGQSNPADLPNSNNSSYSWRDIIVPVSFKPAGNFSSASFSDLIDLNEIFAGILSIQLKTLIV
jgi:hypothetical protein